MYYHNKHRSLILFMTFTAKNTDWGKNDCAVIVGKDKVTQV